jgi:hypothetical protein
MNRQKAQQDENDDVQPKRPPAKRFGTNASTPFNPFSFYNSENIFCKKTRKTHASSTLNAKDKPKNPKKLNELKMQMCFKYVESLKQIQFDCNNDPASNTEQVSIVVHEEGWSNIQIML